MKSRLGRFGAWGDPVAQQALRDTAPDGSWKPGADMEKLPNRESDAGPEPQAAANSCDLTYEADDTLTRARVLNSIREAIGRREDSWDLSFDASGLLRRARTDAQNRVALLQKAGELVALALDAAQAERRALMSGGGE